MAYITGQRKLPVRLIDFNANYVNVFGYGEHVYLGLYVAGFPDTVPILMRTDASGILETLLTKAEAKALVPAVSPGGVTTNCVEIIGVFEAPDGTIFCSTHEVASILRKKPGQAWENVLNTDFESAYSIGANYRGDLFFTGYHRANYGPIVPARRSIYRSTDGGDTWAEVYGEAVRGITGITFGWARGIVVGCTGGMLWSGDWGATFTLVPLAGAEGMRSAIPLGPSEFIVGSSAITARYGGDAGITRFRIYMTTDGGVTWEELANEFPYQLAHAINNLSVSNGVIIGSGQGCKWLYISQDEGATWRILTLPFNGLYPRGCYLTGRTAFVGGILMSTNPFVGRNYTGKLAIIDLSEFVPAQPQEFDMITIDTLANDATSDLVDCAPLKCNDKSVAITVEVTYDGGAAAGIECYVYSSWDKTNYDTVSDEFATIIPSFTAGATRRRTEIINPSARFLKVRVKNLDGAQDATDIKVTATMRG